MPSFQSKSDVVAYVTSFCNEEFDKFPAYYSPNISVKLGEEHTLKTPADVVQFYREERKKMAESIKIEKIVLDKESCVIKAEVIFSPRIDFKDVGKLPNQEYMGTGTNGIANSDGAA